MSNSRNELNRQGRQIAHTICLATLPAEAPTTFAYRSILLPALQEVLEQGPYYWQVITTDQVYYEETFERNFVACVHQAHAFVADISDPDPNMMLELGYIRWGRDADRPLVLLEREGTRNDLPNLAGFNRIRYPDARGQHALSDFAQALRAGFAKHKALQELNRKKSAHFLSPLLLSNTFNIQKDVAEQLSRAFVTMENFVNASIGDIRQRTNLSPGIARGIQQDIEYYHKQLKRSEGIISEQPGPLRVFLCYAREDESMVSGLFQRLNDEGGIDPWLDKEKILGGQNWDLEIHKALRATDVVIVCLSNRSVNKAGYVNKEIKLALDVADQQPEGTIFLIPLKLEDCRVPDRLGAWQWINYYESDGYKRLLLSLKARGDSLGRA